jgi:hypothetical protein
MPKMGPNSIARDHPFSLIFAFFSEFDFYIDFEWIFEAFWSHFGAILALEKGVFRTFLVLSLVQHVGTCFLYICFFF